MEYEHCCRCASSKDKQQIERYQTTTSRRAVKSEDTRVKLRVQEEVTIKAREVTQTVTPQLFPHLWHNIQMSGRAAGRG